MCCVEGLRIASRTALRREKSNHVLLTDSLPTTWAVSCPKADECLPDLIHVMFVRPFKEHSRAIKSP